MREMEIVQYRQIEGLTIFLNTVDYRTPHVHPEWELLWVLDQPLSVTSEQSRFVVEEGDFVLFSPSFPHEFHKTDKSCTFMCLQISPKQVPFVKQVVDGRFPNKYLTEQQISILKEAMKEAGALNAMMSGSGPTVFGIFDDRTVAKEAQAKLKQMHIAKQVYLANVHNTRRK